MTSTNNHTKSDDTKALVPTLIVYFGDLPKLREISTSVQERLLQNSSTGLVRYTDIGIVRHVLVDSADSQPVQKMVLPKFEEWLSPTALLQWSQLGLIVSTNVSHMRVLVCVVDSQVASGDIDQLHQRVLTAYRDRGVANVEVVLYWINDAVVRIKAAYDTVVQIDYKRVLDAESTLEHVIVASCTSSIINTVLQQKSNLKAHHKNKHVQAIWVGCASIYVDVAQIIRAFSDRVTAQFMQAWVSVPVEPRVLSELQQEIRERVVGLQSELVTNSLEMLSSKGWYFALKHDAMYVTQDIIAEPNASGFLNESADVCVDIFGKATRWWTSRPQLKTNLFQRMRALWHEYWQRDEFDFPGNQTIHAGIKRHLIDIYRLVSKQLDAKMDEFHNATNQYFANQLVNTRDYRDNTYGVKRLIASLRIFISEMEQTEEIRFKRSRDGNELVIPTINNVDDMLADEIASLTVIHLQQVRDSLQRRKSRILSLFGTLLRLFIISPVILSIVQAVVGVPMWWQILSVLVLLFGFGTVSFFASMMSYQHDANRIRSEFYEQSLTTIVLAITKHSLAQHQAQFLLHLRQLLHTYTEIDTIIDNSLNYPVPAVRDGQSPTRYMIREIDRVFGTHNIKLDDEQKEVQWRELRNETVRCYLVGQQYNLSWISQMKLRLNKKARHEYPQLPPKAEVMVMKQLAELVNIHHRQSHYALGFVQKNIRDEINSIIQKDPLALEELVDASKELSNGRKWTWLVQHARVDGAPRQIPTGTIVTKSEYLLLSDASQMMLGSITGSSNGQYQDVPILATILPYEMLRVEFEFDFV